MCEVFYSMKRVHCLLGCIIIGLFCTGCWPLRLTTSPGASGMLVDGHTLVPISGAQVQVCRSTYGGAPPRSITDALKNARRSKVITRANGRFSVRREHKWILYFPSPTMAPRTGSLVIQRQGYEPVMLPLISDPAWAGGLSKFLVGDITNLVSLTSKLKMASDPVSAWLMAGFSEDARRAITHFPESGLDPGIMQSILIREINDVISGPSIYEASRFRDVTLDPAARSLLEHGRTLSAMQMEEETYRDVYPNATTPAQVRAFLNRQLLEDAYPGVFSSKIGAGYYQNVGVVLMTPTAR
jgi:hypothetical protein